jgi:hypothetical protein
MTKRGGLRVYISYCTLQIVCDVILLGCLARYAATLGKAHVNAAKRVVKYLYATKNLGIVYKRDIFEAEGLESKKMVVYENGLHPNDKDKDKQKALTIFADSDYAMGYANKSTIRNTFLHQA